MSLFFLVLGLKSAIKKWNVEKFERTYKWIPTNTRGTVRLPNNKKKSHKNKSEITRERRQQNHFHLQFANQEQIKTKKKHKIMSAPRAIYEQNPRNIFGFHWITTLCAAVGKLFNYIHIQSCSSRNSIAPRHMTSSWSCKDRCLSSRPFDQWFSVSVCVWCVCSCRDRRCWYIVRFRNAVASGRCTGPNLSTLARTHAHTIVCSFVGSCSDIIVHTRTH